MISVSSEFNAAQYADVAAVAFKVNLILGDYAASAAGASATSSGDDASGNYPASGAINSDRTEINIGAASAADNGVGKASWKSSANPDGTGNVWLQVAFNTTRTINRLKLFNLAADPLTSYVAQYWNGSAWVTFAGTPDRWTDPNAGFGGGGFGLGPFGGATYPPGYTGGLDIYEFSDISTTKIQIVVYSTESGGPAQIVEVEAYRIVDVTKRTRGYKLDRKKDFKLANPIATQLDVSFDNTDQFFSMSYTPTAAQVAAGYVNAELKTLLFDVELNEGFYTSYGLELIRTFTGNADSLAVSARDGTAEIQARDYMKHLINQTDSPNLKTSVDVKACIQYILNRANISNYQIALDTTNITLDYFFFYQTAVLTAIQDLVQACGDAIFFFDEYGTATFQFYLQSAPNSITDSSFTSATYQGNVAGPSQAISGSPISAFWSNASQWTIQTIPTPKYTVAASGVEAMITSPWPYTTVAGIGKTGTWQCPIYPSSSYGRYYLYREKVIGNPGAAYYIEVNQTQTILYARTNSGTLTALVNLTRTPGASDVYKVTRDGTGLMVLYINGVSQGSATDNTTFTFGLATSISGAGNCVFGQPQYIDGSSTTWNFFDSAIESQVFDQGTAITSEGTFNAVYSTPGSSTLTWYTATSADGVNFDPWVAVTPGGQIGSTVRRYIKYRIVFGVPSSSQGGTTPLVYSVSITYNSGTQTSYKWSPSVNFVVSWNSAIVDLEQQVSDNLGGDTAIVNDVAVTSSPLILGGNSTDTTWQGTAGTPAAKISASNPLVVNVGTYVFNCAISGGMDISGMAGGSCIAITWGTATGTAAITYAHPTKPVLTLTVTHAGTITDLRLIGKTFQNSQSPYQATASDSASIAQRHRRHQDINNNYIISNLVAATIASKTISNFSSPTQYLSKLSIVPKFNVQPGDQFGVTELLSGVNENYYAVGYSRQVKIEGSGKATAQMDVVLLKVPV